LKKKVLFLILVLTFIYSIACAADNDGIPDDKDNCFAICNLLQLDADNDTIGDVCDPDPGCGGCGQPVCEVSCDIDDDGFLNNNDNCPNIANPGQENADNDTGEAMALYKTDCGTDLLVETTIIDVMGNYAFGLSLPRGNYTVAPLNPDYSFGPELIEVMIPQLWFFGPYDFTETD
jgi:hypothetical protein